MPQLQVHTDRDGGDGEERIGSERDEVGQRGTGHGDETERDGGGRRETESNEE